MCLRCAFLLLVADEVLDFIFGSLFSRLVDLLAVQNNPSGSGAACDRYRQVSIPAGYLTQTGCHFLSISRGGAAPLFLLSKRVLPNSLPITATTRLHSWNQNVGTLDRYSYSYTLQQRAITFLMICSLLCFTSHLFLVVGKRKVELNSIH